MIYPKPTILILVLLLAALATETLCLRHSLREQGRLKTQLAAERQALSHARAAHQAYRAAAENMQAKLEAQHRAHTAAVHSLAQALQQNPAWSSQELPDNIKQALEQQP